MRNKRLSMVMASGLMVSAAVWGAVGAQDATPTAPATETGAAGEAAPVAPESDAAAQALSERPFLGVMLEAGEDGVTVAQVLDGSAAAAAGLQVGDVITSVNGTPVTSASEISDIISALAVGDEVSIEVARDGETVTVNAELGAMPQEDFNTPGLPRNRGERGMRELGLEYNTDAGTWTITRLSEDSSLYADGLREGDVINSIDGNTYTLETLIPYLASLEQDATVTLNIIRDGAAQDIQVSAQDFAGSFSFGFNRGNLPDEFRNMMPMFQSMFGGRLGLSFENLDADVAAENNLSVTDGALVKEVVADSPAAEAGVQAGDVITAVNGEAVDAEHTLRDRISAYEPGDVVTLTVIRDGDTQELTATLGEPEMGDMSSFFDGAFPFNFGGRGGEFRFEVPAPAAPDAAPAANM